MEGKREDDGKRPKAQACTNTFLAVLVQGANEVPAKAHSGERRELNQDKVWP